MALQRPQQVTRCVTARLRTLVPIETGSYNRAGPASCLSEAMAANMNPPAIGH